MGTVDVGPVVLGEDVIAGPPVDHRRDGRGEDDSFHARRSRRAQHPQGSLPGGHHDVLDPPRGRAGDRTGDVEHEPASPDRLGPPGVRGEVGGHHVEATQQVSGRGPDVRCQDPPDLLDPSRAADRAPYGVARLEQAHNAVLSQEPGRPGDEHGVGTPRSLLSADGQNASYLSHYEIYERILVFAREGRPAGGSHCSGRRSAAAGTRTAPHRGRPRRGRETRGRARNRRGVHQPDRGGGRHLARLAVSVLRQQAGCRGSPGPSVPGTGRGTRGGPDRGGTRQAAGR